MTVHTQAPVKEIKINENLLLLILAAMNFTHIMDFVVMAPLNPRLKESLFIDSKQFGLLLASYTLSAGIAGIIGSFYIDRFDRRKSLLFLYAGFTVSNLACAMANDYGTFIASRIMAGAFGGVLGSVILSAVGDVVPQHRRGKATGIVMAAFSAASVLGIPVGVDLANKINWHAPFYFITILSSAILILAWFILPSIDIHMQNKNGKTPLENIRSLFANSNVRWSFLFMTTLMLAGLTIVPFVSDYLVNNLGFDKNNLGFIYIYGGLATVISGPLTGKLADRFGKQRVFFIAAIISLIPIYIVTHLRDVDTVTIYIVTTIFFIFFGARFVPAMSMMTSSVDLRQRGVFMSINSSVQQFASSLAVGIAGFIVSNAADGSLVGFDICGIVSCAATVLCILVSFKVKQIA